MLSSVRVPKVGRIARILRESKPKSLHQNQKYNTICSTTMTAQKVKEFFIPFGYGEVAAKAWGDEGGTPVLALHGWQDNLGTFEALVPYLSPSLYIVACDSIGHGLSTHKPPGCFYNYMETLIDVKRVVDYLKWKKFYILGHSLGGTVALLYASVYAEAVAGIVLLDIVKPFSRSFSELPMTTRKALDSFLQLESKLDNPVPIYTYDRARERLLEGSHGQLTEESADILLKRSCKTSDCGKGVIFARDLRVKVSQDLQMFSHEALKAYMENVKCDLLIILARESVMNTSLNSGVNSDFLSIYKKNCSSFALDIVEGSHYVHLNNPERVAPLINQFFQAHSKL